MVQIKHTRDVFMIEIYYVFISHMVQIKRYEDEVKALMLLLYIPYGSNKTTSLIRFLLLLFCFISHMVQIKQSLFLFSLQIYHIFISHMVQIKHGKKYA